jgi:hypothetical protein
MALLAGKIENTVADKRVAEKVRALGFTTSKAGTVTTVRLPVKEGTSIPGNVKFAFFTDASGEPGEQLGAVVTVNLPNETTTLELKGFGKVNLEAETNYFFCLLPTEKALNYYLVATAGGSLESHKNHEPINVKDFSEVLTWKGEAENPQLSFEVLGEVTEKYGISWGKTGGGFRSGQGWYGHGGIFAYTPSVVAQYDATVLENISRFHTPGNGIAALLTDGSYWGNSSSTNGGLPFGHSATDCLQGYLFASDWRQTTVPVITKLGARAHVDHHVGIDAEGNAHTWGGISNGTRGDGTIGLFAGPNYVNGEFRFINSKGELEGPYQYVATLGAPIAKEAPITEIKTKPLAYPVKVGQGVVLVVGTGSNSEEKQRQKFVCTTEVPAGAEAITVEPGEGELNNKAKYAFTESSEVYSIPLNEGREKGYSIPYAATLNWKEEPGKPSYFKGPDNIERKLVDAVATYTTWGGLDEGGYFWVCGENGNGELANGVKSKEGEEYSKGPNGAYTPEMIKPHREWIESGGTKGLAPFDKVFASENGYFGRIAEGRGVLSGKWYVWGKNKYGQLCTATNMDAAADILSPVEASYLNELVTKRGQVADIAVLDQTTIVLLENGEAFSCGSNQTGALGQGWEELGTTTTAIAEGALVSIVHTSPLSHAVKKGQTIWLEATKSQAFIATAEAAVGAEEIHVEEEAAKRAYPEGSTVSLGGEPELQPLDLPEGVEVIAISGGHEAGMALVVNKGKQDVYVWGANATEGHSGQMTFCLARGEEVLKSGTPLLVELPPGITEIAGINMGNFGGQVICEGTAPESEAAASFSPSLTAPTSVDITVGAGAPEGNYEVTAEPEVSEVENEEGVVGEGPTTLTPESGVKKIADEALILEGLTLPEDPLKRERYVVHIKLVGEEEWNRQIRTGESIVGSGSGAE